MVVVINVSLSEKKNKWNVYILNGYVIIWVVSQFDDVYIYISFWHDLNECLNEEGQLLLSVFSICIIHQNTRNSLFAVYVCVCAKRNRRILWKFITSSLKRFFNGNACVSIKKKYKVTLTLVRLFTKLIPMKNEWIVLIPFDEKLFFYSLPFWMHVWFLFSWQ